MPREIIQRDPVVFNEFTHLMLGDIPINPENEEPYELTEEQRDVRKDVIKILRTVHGLRRALDRRQEEYMQLKRFVGKDVQSGLFQDYISGRQSHSHFGR